MPIEFVGTSTISGSGSSLSLSLASLTGGIASSPQEGDIVFVLCGGGSNKGTTAIQMVATGYTEWQAPFGRNDSYDTSISAYYKVQGSTPDTSVTITNDSSTFTISARAMVFRGVDTANLGKGALQGGANTGLPNLPSSTPTVDGSVIMDFSVAAHNLNATAHTSSDYDTGLFFSAGYDGGTYDHTSSVGVKFWTSGAFDPAVYGGYSVSAQHSWSGFRTTLAPTPEPLTEPYAVLLTSGGSTTNSTSYTTASVTITAGRPALAIVYSGGLTASDNGDVPSLSGAGQTWTVRASFIPALHAEYQTYQRITVFETDAASGGSGVLIVNFGVETQDIVAWQVVEAVGGVFGTMEGESSTTALQSTTHSLALSGVSGSERYLAVAFWVYYAGGSPGGFTPRSGWIELGEQEGGDTAIDCALQTQLSPLGGDTDASFSVSVGGGLTLIAFPVGPAGDPPVTLSAPPVSAGLATVAAAALGQIHAITAAALLAGGAVPGAPAVAQAHSLAGQPVIAGEAALGAASIGAAAVDLAADPVGAGAALLSLPALGQVHGLAAPGFAGGSSVAAAPGLFQVHALTAAPLLAGGGVAASPDLAQTHGLAPSTLLAGVYSVGPVLIGQAHGLAPAALLAGGAVIPAVTPGSIAPPDAVLPEPLSAGAAGIEAPALAQRHGLLPLPSTAPPASLHPVPLAQRHALAVEDLSAGVALDGAAPLGQRYALGLAALANGQADLGAVAMTSGPRDRPDVRVVGTWPARAAPDGAWRSGEDAAGRWDNALRAAGTWGRPRLPGTWRKPDR